MLRRKISAVSQNSRGRIGYRSNTPSLVRITVLFAATVMAVTISGCSSASEKKYNIAPIFPLSADKCAKYHGDQKGQGITASCMVTKAECEKAAADWKQAMQISGVNDAIQFSCD